MPQPHEAPWWVGRHQAEDHPALRLAQPWLPPRAGPIAEPVEPLGVEAEQPLAHRLRMAAQLVGDGGGPEPVPTAHDHPRAADPVTGGMPAPGQLPNATFLRSIERRAGAQQLRHGGLLGHRPALSMPALRNGALAVVC